MFEYYGAAYFLNIFIKNFFVEIVSALARA